MGIWYLIPGYIQRNVSLGNFFILNTIKYTDLDDKTTICLGHMVCTSIYIQSVIDYNIIMWTISYIYTYKDNTQKSQLQGY
jgi:hypothetical protein